MTLNTDHYSGTLDAVQAHGSVCAVVIDGQARYAETRLMVEALRDSGMAPGDAVDFDITDWGGLAWIAPADREIKRWLNR